MAITKLEAIKSLEPNAEFVISGDVIKEWHSEDITQPTDEAIATEQARLQAEYDANQYQRDRAVEYPSIPDQLDDIFHNGLDGWKATIQETKDKYPKP
jgi:hypothetical protein